MVDLNTLSRAGDNETIVELDVDRMERGHFQPRDIFDPEAMEATRKSIEENGQLYPVIARKIASGNILFKESWKETHYELADGERRWRCCKKLGYKKIKAVIRDLSDEQMLEYALSTNDSVPLNPIERAKVFQILAKEFKNSQEEIALSYNMKQQQVSEYIRLLELPDEIKEFTARAVISVRHAREILKVPDNETRILLAREVVHNGLSTRDLLERVKIILGKAKIVENESISREKIYQDDLVINFPKQNSDKIVKNSEEIKKIEDILYQKDIDLIKEHSRIFKKKRKYESIQPILSILSQLNSIIILKPVKKWMKKYMESRPNLKSLTPEYYFAWFELCLALPTIILYVLYGFAPIAALAIGCIGLAILLLKLFEDNAG